MHETFWTLLRDRAHWEFEIFLMILFDVILAGIWQFFARMHRRKAQPVKMKTPEGICDGCGGTVKHLIESSLKWCLGCGHIKVADQPKVVPETFSEMVLCNGCGKWIQGPYGSIGGNIVPYIPAKHYHMGCIPQVKMAEYHDFESTVSESKIQTKESK